MLEMTHTQQNIFYVYTCNCDTVVMQSTVETLKYYVQTSSKKLVIPRIMFLVLFILF